MPGVCGKLLTTKLWILYKYFRRLSIVKEKMKYLFGHKLRTVRERKGYTLKDVASRAEVSESLISQIERNKVSPSIDTLLLIADILDIDYELSIPEQTGHRFHVKPDTDSISFRTPIPF